jgi:hypothetical protein
MKKRINAKQFLAVCWLVGLCALTAAAQTKPDFSGTWKMNPAKSKFERGGPNSITIKFEQKDANLSEVMTLGGDGGGGERSVEAKYTADGKETDVAMGDQTVKGSIKWEGETLIIAWKGDDRSFTRKCKLSADGKIMTLEVINSNSNGTATDLVVFDKQ